MSGAVQGSNWDFTPVFELLRHFSAESGNHSIRPSKSSSDVKPTQPDKLTKTSLPDSIAGLGDFDRIWEFLGKVPSTPLPRIVLPDDPDIPIESIKNGDSEDLQDTKAVHWRDEIDGADLADDDELASASNQERLTRKQKKQIKKKIRKEATRAGSIVNANDSTSSETESAKALKNAHYRRKIIQGIIGAGPATDVTGQHVQILARPQPPLSEEKWSVARPFAPVRPPRAFSEPPQSDFVFAAERKARLMGMLAQEFPDERSFRDSTSLFPLTRGADGGTGGSVEGLHVFVDASNVCQRREKHSLPGTFD